MKKAATGGRPRQLNERIPSVSGSRAGMAPTKELAKEQGQVEGMDSHWIRPQ